ncbi:DUF6783 domain-containing protein [Otoolea muris]|uniref:DUF6783 domain-containing protein n=1 Tax=Otoolea muris TaxID=2941515 RepID=UPI003A7F3B37
MKIHSWHLHAPLRGIFGPNSLNAARCAAFIWPKSPTKWHAQLPESNFQTRSRMEQSNCSDKRNGYGKGATAKWTSLIQ